MHLQGAVRRPSLDPSAARHPSQSEPPLTEVPIPEARPPAPGGRPRVSANMRGMLWMLLSAVGFAGVGAVVKLASARLDPLQISFFRTLSVVVFLVPVFARTGWRHAVPLYPLRHVGRASTALVATVCSYYAFATLPMATVVSITFTSPLFMIVIAVLFLGETVRWQRWAATVVGFAGVLIMMRPGTGHVGPEGLWAVANALLVAASTAQVKSMPADERDSTLLFTFGAFSSLALAVPAWMVWRMPTPAEWGLLAMVCVLGFAAQAAVIRAYRVGADATFVAPFDYARLLVATSLGFLLFDEVPDLWTAAGAAVIVGSTLYIASRRKSG